MRDPHRDHHPICKNLESHFLYFVGKTPPIQRIRDQRLKRGVFSIKNARNSMVKLICKDFLIWE